MLYGLARQALFRLDAETAHEWTLSLLARMPASGALLAGPAIEDPVECLGLRLRNRVGLAAGLDKNGVCLEAWDRLGFGFVEVGTVTPRPQPGNPRPRMFRLPQQSALINRLGFNNLGVDALIANLRERPFGGVLGINIGKNADTPLELAAEDYRIGLEKVYPHASYVTVNVSSPNTRNLRDLQDEARLDALLASLAATRQRLADAAGRQVPLLVKLAPDMGDEQLAAAARIARARGIDGLIATNTTVSRSGVASSPHASEAGGLSGGPLKPLATDLLRRLRAHVGPDYPLIGVGGILSAEDARERRAAGADLVQLYTGLIYRGPALVSECARALRV